MGGGSQAKDHPYEYLAASALSAAINYPLWRASAVGQSGFRVTASSLQGIVPGQLVTMVPSSIAPYLHAFAPPYKGMVATISGMTWARAAIFWGSDRGKEVLQSQFPHLHPSVSTILPPLLCSIGVQCVNQPLVRASITLQNPESDLPNVRAAVKKIYNAHGLVGLWHGTVCGNHSFIRSFITII